MDCHQNSFKAGYQLHTAVVPADYFCLKLASLRNWEVYDLWETLIILGVSKLSFLFGM